MKAHTILSQTVYVSTILFTYFSIVILPYSEWFSIIAGVRQGGILSPDFYCLYVEDLIIILKSKNVGCHIMSVFLATLIYADDISAVSERSLCSLRCMQ